ncbi:MAG: cohesin domain-containing protein [Desulfosalsimonadaceae bacterium]
MKFNFLILFIIGTLMLIPDSVAADNAATKLYIPEIEATSGQSFQASVKIDPVDNLAGVKLVLEYDANLLKFEKVEKTKPSAGLMHVVNDQKPGRLIIVMAGAKGISGKDIAILLIHFMALPDISEKTISSINITEIELMTDALKTVPCGLSDSRIMILPSNPHPRKLRK